MKHPAAFYLALTLLGVFWATAQAEEHEWKNKQGKTILAEFVSATADSVTISKQGKTYVVKLADLSPASQALARKLAQAKAGIPTDKLTPEEVTEVLGMRLGEWTAVVKGETEIFEEFVTRWKKKGESIEVHGQIGGRRIHGVVTYDPKLGVFVEKFTLDDGKEVIRHGRWDRKNRTLAIRVISPKLPPGVEEVLTLKKTEPDTILGKVVVRQDGEVVSTREIITTRKPIEKLTREEPALKTETTDDGVLVTESGAKVLFYQRATKSKEGKHPRANYVHPLYDLDGNVLTEDFPADHPHHRGIFWAWHQLWVGDQQIGDGWIAKDMAWDVRSLKASHGQDGSLTIQVTVDWKSPQWHDGQKTLVEETTSIRIYPRGGSLRKLDFDIRLQAVEPDTRLGGAENIKGYGGFSTRIKLPDTIRFSGQKGAVTPQRTPVVAGPWVDMAAEFDKSGTSGLTVLCHPESAGYPQPWILRNNSSMQNPVWPGQHAKPLPTDRALVLRYRLVLHRGAATTETINQWHEAYAATP
ncbi:MAG: DUF6807 family protein [Pirellulales bacterium]